MLTAIQVARYFIYRSIPGTKENITNLKLQKLLYFAQGHFLAEKGIRNPLFPEDIKAWAHGPVVPEIYRMFSNYKFSEIKREQDDNIINEILQSEENNNEEYLQILNHVWERYKDKSGKELEKITHEEGPWQDIRGDLPPFISTNYTIPRLDIFNHFMQQTVSA